MKKQASLLFFLLFFCVGFNQQKDIWHYIEKEKIIAEKKEDAHASFTSFSSVANAQENRPIFRQSLNRIWKFNWIKNLRKMPHRYNPVDSYRRRFEINIELQN